VQREVYKAHHERLLVTDSGPPQQAEISQELSFTADRYNPHVVLIPFEAKNMPSGLVLEDGRALSYVCARGA